ncbi:MAG TPA: ribosome maturation factor RimP [Deltaproteobacteria bacterium]|nr:ribosome maturation factor RimP [Deltaproteobacteria bacterium]HQM21166.1 ribosome maturation factor RimP [Deltaproteobacteria bacterium]HRC97477.1 ribosome maturation factor RimP [Deltaproteobacteria bacterium]
MGGDEVGDSPLFYFIMKETGLQKEIYKLISPEIAVMGFELIEVDFSGGALRLTIDKPGGVTIDDCVSVNRRVSLLLDTRDPIEGSYRLEVSSPGLNRRLKTPGEFEHFAGRKVKVQTKEGTYRGIIRGLAGEAVLIDVEGTELKFSFEDIQKANLEFDF